MMNVQLLQCFDIGDVCLDRVRESIELRDIRLNGLAEVRTVLNGRDDWESHLALRNEHFERRCWE